MSDETFYVVAELDWVGNHPFETREQLADALDRSAFTVLTDEQTGRTLIATTDND